LVGWLLAVWSWLVGLGRTRLGRVLTQSANPSQVESGLVGCLVVCLFVWLVGWLVGWLVWVGPGWVVCVDTICPSESS
jgi:hypothetical protein